MTYLITGATGEIGSHVVENLLRQGERPRVFVRNAQKARERFGSRVDVTVGDLRDPESLRAALRDVDSLFLVNSGPDLPRLDCDAALAAKAAGAKLLVKLSSLDAEQNVGTGVWHAQGEAAIRDGGIAFTFVRPTGFMSNALWWAPSIKADGVVRSATGHGKIPFIHSDDIAAVTVAALAGKFVGQALPITGPQALSYAEMATKIGAALGKQVRFEALSEEQEREKMIEIGESEEMVAAHLSIYQAIREGRLATVTDTVQRVLGRKPITFDQWVQQHAAAFH